MFDLLSGKFSQALRHVRGKARITESNVEAALGEVRSALLEADVDFGVVKGFVSSVREKALGAAVARGVDPGQQFVKIVRDELAEVMGGSGTEPGPPGRPAAFLVVGPNGQGKTTFSGKLALRLAGRKKSVLLVPADTLRPAAKEQLATLAARVGAECFDSDLSLHPREIVLKAMAAARRGGKDAVIVDTAGRLHVDEELMEQIREVRRALEGERPEVLMVADAMTGRGAVAAAESFHKAVSLTGVVLSKMDSDARGGAALSIRRVTGLPIRYMSTGEGMGDLELFHPDRMAGRILDMGDVVSLVEKAEKVVDEREAGDLAKRIESGRMTVEDFMRQMEMLGRMGNLSSLLKMIPGMGAALRGAGDLSPVEEEMRRYRVVIGSMTPQERRDRGLIKGRRVTRIAAGAGVSPKVVHEFLGKFSQMEAMMRRMLPMMKAGALPGLAAGGGVRGVRAPKAARRPGKGKGRGPWGKGFF